VAFFIYSIVYSFTIFLIHTPFFTSTKPTAHLIKSESWAIRNTICTGSTVNLLGVRSVHVGGDIALLGEPFLQMLRDVFHENFQPLNKSDKVHLELFVNDYEQVRLAATIMCLDAIFRK